ncbi:MAG: hypothetical protein IPI25_14580 [Candidatus Brocadia sp.]|nr:MAG: hypothetical protein IPI25_14580 [Candidatus Brocadia sp.]
MPDILRKVVGLMIERFVSAMDGSIKLVTQLEEASKPIDSLSTTLIQNANEYEGRKSKSAVLVKNYSAKIKDFVSMPYLKNGNGYVFRNSRILPFVSQ